MVRMTVPLCARCRDPIKEEPWRLADNFDAAYHDVCLWLMLKEGDRVRSRLEGNGRDVRGARPTAGGARRRT